ncbi:hypothetical protein B0H16DRAFT_1881115 [Mycena metata]|uniref:F-box domain-containing protein n=1 Tax=Mycena metata TaxID=1033252 RepID=A0AAD7NR13_9AGAR|nr:hypothetical protein B0H16DRAFT_1881115 [Mycena metata]
MIHFIDFPTEILVIIFSSLDLAALTSCLATNRRLKSIIDVSTLLQYRLAAQAACVEDNPWNTETDAAKLGALQRRQVGFPKFGSHFNFDYQATNCEVRAKICSVCLRETTIELDDLGFSNYVFSGNILAVWVFDKSDGLRFFSLRTSVPVFERLEVSGYIQGLGLAIPEEDLLVIVSSSEPLMGRISFEVAIKLHLYEASTQSAHKMACKPVIHLPVPSTEYHPLFTLDICGPKVVVLVDYSGYDKTHLNRLLVYDWKLGRLLATFDDYSIATFLSPVGGNEKMGLRVVDH